MGGADDGAAGRQVVIDRRLKLCLTVHVKPGIWFVQQPQAVLWRQQESRQCQPAALATRQ